MIIFASEQWRDMRHEFDVLGEASFKECDNGGGYFPYAPDYETLDYMDNDGSLHMTTARDDGRLVGYVMSAIQQRHLQFKACASQCISVYLLPEFRHGLTGVKMMNYDQESLRKLGVEMMYGGYTLNKNLAPLFEKGGWQEVERIYVKYLGDRHG
jgi:GNAT superfamily N-acetyltransferase